MNRHSRFIVTILAIIFSITALTTITAFAEGYDGQSIYADPDQQQSYVEPEPQDSYVEPEPQPSYVEPDPQPSYVEPEPQQSYVDPGYDPGSYEPSDDEPSYNGGGSGGNEVYYDSDGNEYSDYSEMYVGGDQTYTPPASTPSTTAALYDTSKNKVDNSTLSQKDWDAIKASLGNGNKTTANNSDGDDFAWIQGNTSRDDDGHWRLVLGIALIVLSLAGFAYLIFSAVSRRKKTALAHAGKAAAAAANAPRYRSNSDYDDDFSSSSKKPKNGKRYK